MKHTSVLSTIALTTFIIGCGVNQPSANLIQNGSAELPKYDSVPTGWQNVQGHWATLEGDSVHRDYGFAQQGKYYFFAGNDTLGILQQDVNVSHRY